jgi:hypothetical protein
MSQRLPKQSIEALEARLQQRASHFPYPPTPDIAGHLSRQLNQLSRPATSLIRPLAWGMFIVVLLLAILLGVPSVRAAVVELLQLGAVRIYLTEPTPTTLPGETPASTKPRPSATATPLASLINMAGETTLAQAQAQLDFPIRLPSVPPDLGPPDKVYLQDFEGPLVVLVWLEPDNPGKIRLSLHLLGPNSFAGKGGPETVEETTVHGQPALWVSGPHLFWLRDRQAAIRRLVEGNTLIWTEGEITYRLETNLSLAEAIKIAESLQ